MRIAHNWQPIILIPQPVVHSPVEVLMVVMLVLSYCDSYKLFQTNGNLSHHVGYSRKQVKTCWWVLFQHNYPSHLFLLLSLCNLNFTHTIRSFIILSTSQWCHTSAFTYAIPPTSHWTILKDTNQCHLLWEVLCLFDVDLVISSQCAQNIVCTLVLVLQ